MALAKIGSGDALDTDHSDFYLNLARPPLIWPNNFKAGGMRLIKQFTL
jgi:hypothetical protein